MRPSGPPTPPWPTYMRCPTVDSRGRRYPSYHRRDRSVDATRAPAHGHRYSRHEPVGRESYRTCPPVAGARRPAAGIRLQRPDALTAALVMRWSPGHAPISAARLRSLVFRGLYTAREKPPAIEADVPPEIQSQKVSHKIHKPISQFLAPHLRPSSDRLRTREVVAAFWALPNDVHAVL